MHLLRCMHRLLLWTILGLYGGRCRQCIYLTEHSPEGIIDCVIIVRVH